MNGFLLVRVPSRGLGMPLKLYTLRERALVAAPLGPRDLRRDQRPPLIVRVAQSTSVIPSAALVKMHFGSIATGPPNLALQNQKMALHR